MPRDVANTLLPAARPASTIARPRPRELPVTNHTCAIHPPVYRSQPLGYSIEASQTQDWMHDGYTNGPVSYGGNQCISPLRHNADNYVSVHQSARNVHVPFLSISLQF